MAYTGTSIVDYLKSVGQPSDFAYRTKLATEKGITNYIGSTEQNLRLLSMLQTPIPTPLAPATQPPLTGITLGPAGEAILPPPTPEPGKLGYIDPKTGLYIPYTTPIPAPITPTPPAYTGVSIVDYLTSIGQPSDFASRTKLAQQYGITNYIGTAEQNTQLLGMLRSGFKPPTTPTPPPTPIPQKTIYTDLNTFLEAFKKKYLEYPTPSAGLSVEEYWEQRKQYPAWMKALETYEAPPPPVTPPPVIPPPVTPVTPPPEEPKAPPTTAEDWMKQTWDLMSKFPEAVKEAYKPVAEAITTLTEAIKNRPSLVEEYKKMMEEYKMPEMTAELTRLQSRATAIEEQIEALPEDVKGRVKNFLITQTQYERVTAAEAAPLTKLFNALARASTAKAAEIEAARGEVGTILGLMSKDIDRTEEALKWGLEGAKSQAELETRLAEKGIEFMKWGAETAMAIEEAKPTPVLGAAAYLGLTGTQATAFQTDLETEITNVYSGKYGTQPGTFIREQALTRLNAKYPQLSSLIPDIIYGNPAKGIPATFPDGFEAKIVSEEGAGAFTDVETRKLEQAGLSGASRSAQLEFLYGTKVLTPTQLTKLAVAGIPNDVAIKIQSDLNEGYSLDQIKQDLAKIFGQDVGFSYVDRFIETMKTSAADELMNLIMGLGG